MKRFIASLFLITAALFTVVPQSTLAQSPAPKKLSEDQRTLCTSVKGNKVVTDNDGNESCKSDGRKLAGGTDSFLATVVNLLLYLAGALAVIVIIFGGIRYITSTGDAARIKQAKDTILYGVVGLVVALLAYAIVNTVANQLGGV